MMSPHHRHPSLRPTTLAPARAMRPADPRTERTERTERTAARPGSADALFIAIVHTADAVRFVAASPRMDELRRQLADYVRQRGEQALWPADAERLRALLAAGEPDAAITHYFETAGRRWDAEWLITGLVAADGVAGGMLGWTGAGARTGPQRPLVAPAPALEVPAGA